ncbi:MliC family protein [Methylocystis parvus]|nr:MliC family protein [Methylocystis parvus]WBK00131.1 MliC family protein [Methylocystis parvus OBBP]
MMRAALALLSIFLAAGSVLADPADCARASKAPVKFICEDPTLAALDKEVARLADLAATGSHVTSAQKRMLALSQASFRKTIAACRDAKLCLQRTLVERVFHLRQGYADVRTKDSEGISLGPFAAACAGFDGPLAVTFIKSDPALGFLAWRDKAAVLTQAVAASGARYAGTFGTGELQFWNKGKEATLDMPGKPTLTCEMQGDG